MQQGIEDALIRLFVVLMVWMGACMLYFLLVWLPVTMHTEAQCLRNGYPRAYVTVGLERYCANLEGVVTVRVERVSK